MTPTQARLLSLFKSRCESLLIDRADELDKYFGKLLVTFPDQKDYIASTQNFVMAQLGQARQLCDDMTTKLKES